MPKSGLRTVRAADDDRGTGNALVTRAAKLGGKSHGFCFFPLAIAGLARLDARKAHRAAGGGGPLDIARGQIPFRSGFRPPNANEQKSP
jgi:hypothetical protein